jgi:hypothetical protein
MQLVRKKCLVIVAEPTAYRLYIEDSVNLEAAVYRGAGKHAFSYDRLGAKCIFAVDQSAHLLAIIHGQEVGLSHLAVPIR